MTNSNSNFNSGDGTRPSTDGGVDNMGAGEKFSSSRNRVGEDVAGPAPVERMRDKKRDVQGTKADDSAPFGLTQDLGSQRNQEKPPTIEEAKG
ncbi:hypothetical protein QTI66_34595 [Variovorax sp. J22R133]|uniref:hypothetical protein n=1 Tax=Variovorax brevis TaxID=3053503 RepID=UPI0025764F6C|nr:hypothetical protein [Variovorax sp. J22R133]MDM0117252.1 hypothetical protein [Variovorax sp. J22R133]